MFSLTQTVRAYTFCIALVLSYYGHAQTNTFNASVNNNWNNTANWSLNRLPLATDNVVIPDGISVIVNVAAVCNNFTINGGGTATTVTISGTNSLTADGTVTLNAGTGNGDHRTIAVGGGYLNCANVSLPATANDNIQSRITIANGRMNVSGNIVMGADPDRSYIQITSTGIINLDGSIAGGNLISNANSIFNYKGTVAQTVVFGNYVYGNLYINNTSLAGATLAAAVTATNVLTNLNIQSGTLNNGGYAITLSNGDDFIVSANATFILTGTSVVPSVSGGGLISIATTSTIGYHGANQDVSALTYGNLSLAGTGKKQLQGSATINGNFSLATTEFETNYLFSGDRTVTINGDFSQTSGSITGGSIVFNTTFSFDGGRQHMFTGGTISDNNNILVTSGDTLQPASSTTLINGNNFTLSNGATLGVTSAAGITTSGASGLVRVSGTRTYSTGANYIYNGSGTQTAGNGLTQNTPANLTVNNPGNTVSLSANTTISGNLLISSGYFASNAFTFTLGGNFTNNGTGFTSTGAGNVVLNGAGTQTIGGSTSTSFNNLNLNKTSGTVLLAQNINVNAALNIGVNLNLASHILTMGSSSPAIGTLGTGSFSATKMVIASGGGELRKNLSAGSAVAFPIGDDTGTPEYSPAAVVFTGGIYAGYVSAKVIDAKHPQNGNTTNYLTRYWTFSQTGLTGFSAVVGVNYVDTDIAGNESDIRMGKWNGATPWVRFDPSITPSSNLLNATVTSFSDFTGLDNLELLPSKLVYFQPTAMDKSTLLEWTTAEEINSAHYNVEYSSDGRNFITLSKVNSHNSPTGSAYTYKHLNPINGKNYYRLKMVDIDEKFEYSPIVVLKHSGEQKHLNAYPNPASDNVTIQFEKAGKGAFIKVVDMQGKLVRSVSVPAGTTMHQVKLTGLNRGLYNIIYENGGEKTICRIQRN